jgi:hypothetical protein
MTEININELQQARYMGLSCPPASSQAKSLLDNIINIILKSEQRTRARKSDDAIAFKSALGLIVVLTRCGLGVKISVHDEQYNPAEKPKNGG